MTTLYLVRHGQTDWNLATRFQGHSDIPLNETGLEQAAKAARDFNGLAVDAIYASDLARAQQTAKFFAIDSGLPIQSDARLREIYLGAWEGKIINQIREEYPELVSLRRTQPTRYSAPDGETILQVAQRVGSAADEMSAVYPQGKVLVVAHGMSMATLYCLAEEIDLDMAFNYIFDNAEIRPVEWFPGKGKMVV